MSDRSAPDGPGGRTDDGSGPHLFPVSPSWFEVGFYLFLLVWIGYLLYQATGYTQFEDYFFPYVLGVPLVLLVVLHLVRLRYPDVVDRFVPEEAAAGAPSDVVEVADHDEPATTTRPAAERERLEVFMIGWLVLLPVMMYVAGMGWTIVIYTFALTWFLTRDVKQAAIVTAIVLVFIYVLFIHLLDMIVWTGTLGLPDPLETIDRFV